MPLGEHRGWISGKRKGAVFVHAETAFLSVWGVGRVGSADQKIMGIRQSELIHLGKFHHDLTATEPGNHS